MRFSTYRHLGGAERVGLVVGDELYGLAGSASLLGLLGDDGERLRAAGERARSDPAEVVADSSVEVLAPIPVPPSVRDFLSFEAHRRNARGGADPDPDWYERPVFYFSNPAATCGPASPVRIAPGSVEWDYELEFAAIIGQSGSDLDPEGAEARIAGYCVLCDFSARDLQRQEMRQGLGPAKGKDSATSIGPYLVTPDELTPYRAKRAFGLEMGVSVNGRGTGGGGLDEIYWSFGEMIAYASRGTELRPGDVFGSGTVGTGCLLEHHMLGRGEEYPWLQPGDVVELSVEHVGSLRHEILEATPLRPLRSS